VGMLGEVGVGKNFHTHTYRHTHTHTRHPDWLSRASLRARGATKNQCHLVQIDWCDFFTWICCTLCYTTNRKRTTNPNKSNRWILSILVSIGSACVRAKVGVIYVDGEWYFIEPLKPATGNTSGDDDDGDGGGGRDLVEHVIYPRNATTQSPAQQRPCDVRG